MRCRHCLGIRSVMCPRCRREVPFVVRLMEALCLLGALGFLLTI